MAISYDDLAHIRAFFAGKKPAREDVVFYTVALGIARHMSFPNGLPELGRTGNIQGADWESKIIREGDARKGAFSIPITSYSQRDALVLMKVEHVYGTDKWSVTIGDVNTEVDLGDRDSVLRFNERASEAIAWSVAAQ